MVRMCGTVAISAKCASRSRTSEQPKSRERDSQHPCAGPECYGTLVDMRRLSTAVVLFLSLPCNTEANQESVRLRARAFQLAYNLDYDAATREMEAAARADPNDAATQRRLAVIPWLLISFTRGAATVDDYLGS